MVVVLGNTRRRWCDSEAWLVWFARGRFLLECGLIVAVRKRRSGCVIILLVAWCSSIGEM